MLEICKMKTKPQIGRAVAKRYGVHENTGRQRFDKVWAALCEEAHCDIKFERHKISNALLRVLDNATKDYMGEGVIKKMLDSVDDPHWQARVFAKWDPYKAQAIILRTIKQYTQLHGADAPEQIEVKGTVDVIDPLLYTPQERHKRIAELILKRELQGPIATEETPAREKLN